MPTTQDATHVHTQLKATIRNLLTRIDELERENRLLRVDNAEFREYKRAVHAMQMRREPQEYQ